MTAPRTIEPVRQAGWYEHTDGTVGRYSWTRGYAYLQETRPSWEHVPTQSQNEARWDRVCEAMDRQLERDR